MQRVKCANCGMVWEINLNSPFKQQCPACNSNAYDPVDLHPDFKKPENWRIL